MKPGIWTAILCCLGAAAAPADDLTIVTEIPPHWQIKNGDEVLRIEKTLSRSGRNQTGPFSAEMSIEYEMAFSKQTSDTLADRFGSALNSVKNSYVSQDCHKMADNRLRK